MAMLQAAGFTGTRLRVSSRPVVSLLAIAFLLCGVASGAESSPNGRPTLDLAAAERMAVARDHAIASLEAQAEASAERAIAAGQLPDPELMIGYENLPTRGFPTSDDMMTMLMIGVRQHLPTGRARALQRRQGEIGAAMRRAEGAERELEVLREVRRAWLDWYFAHASVALLREALDDVDELIALTERRVAAGTAQSRELFQARLEHATFRERLIELDTERVVAAAELERWLGERVGERVPAALPDWPTPDEAQLRERLSWHPTLDALEQQRSAGRVATDLARQAYRPEWMVELSYGYRRGADMATGAPRSDMLTGIVSVTLPLFPSQRQDRQLAAARRELDAAGHDHADSVRRLEADLERNWARWVRLDELADFYRIELLPEAEQTVTAIRNAYRSDLAPIGELIRAQVDEREYRLRALGVERERREAHLELLYLSGE